PSFRRSDDSHGDWIRHGRRDYGDAPYCPTVVTEYAAMGWIHAQSTSEHLAPALLSPSQPAAPEIKGAQHGGGHAMKTITTKRHCQTLSTSRPAKADLSWLDTVLEMLDPMGKSVRVQK